MSKVSSHFESWAGKTRQQFQVLTPSPDSKIGPEVALCDFAFDKPQLS
jgi:hypothetical protein